jgi:hypothetical protein
MVPQQRPMILPVIIVIPSIGVAESGGPSPTAQLNHTVHTPWTIQPLTHLEVILYNKIVSPLIVIESSTLEIEQMYESGRRVRELGPQDGSFIARGLYGDRESRWNRHP